jgi:hypothetical protein
MYQVALLSWAIWPQLLCNILDQAQLSKHLLLRHALCANSYAGKAALRADADVLHDLLDATLLTICNDLGGFQDSLLDLLGIFELGIFGCDYTENDVLALGKETQRLEAAGPGVVVF